MQTWTLAGIRVDIELAVALEVAVLELARAETVAEHDQAMAFNRDLWRLVGSLATTAPNSEDCVELRATADRMVGGGAADFTDINRHFARLLAGRVTSAGSLRVLMNEWRAFRAAQPQAEFGAWLLGRMVCLASAAGRMAA
jgi:hypothetical protein